MPRPPRELGYFDKVNYVIDSWVRPCEAPWYVYIETLWPAALEGFLVLITFGWADVARGYWRPKGMRGRRFGKRKGKWRRRIPRFPEIGNLIGSQLPGAERFKDRHWGAGGRHLWAIDGVAQRLLFGWLVIDVTVDFFYNWTTLLNLTAWCKNSHLGRFSYQNLAWFPTANGGWRLAGFGWKDYQHGTPTWVFNHGSTGARPCQVTAALSFKRRGFFPPPNECAVRIRDDTGPTVFATSGPQQTDADGKVQIPVMAIVPPGRNFRVEHSVDVPGANVGFGVVVAHELDE